jgi:serine phosphatase RsbU (regulator of sigma subunit)
MKNLLILKSISLNFIFLLFLVGSVNVFASTSANEQEIKTTLDTIQNDTNKIKYIRSVVKSFDKKDSQLAFKYLEIAKQIAIESNEIFWEIKVLKLEAYLLHNYGNINKSKIVFKEAFKKARANSYYDLQMEILFIEICLYMDKGKLEDVLPKSKYLHPILNKLPSREMHATYLSRIGRSYYANGNYSEAMKYYIQSQDVFEKHNILTVNYGHLLHNIGSVFKRQGDIEKALTYYEQELALGREINDDETIAEGLYLTASIYMLLGEKKKSRRYTDQALEMFEKMNNTRMVALLTANMGLYLSGDGDFVTSQEYMQKGLDIFTEENEYDKISWIQRSMASNFIKLHDYNKALAYLKLAKENALKTNKKQLLRLKEIAQTEATAYYKKSDFKNAFESYKYYIALKDSMTNNDKMKVIDELEAKYETAKKESEIALLNKDKKLKAIQLEKKEAEVNEQKTMRNGMILVVGLIAIVLGIIYRGYRINKKNNNLLTIKNDEINLKNSIIEEKNKNITDSIAYAKRIQSAILPPKKLLKEYLKNGFIYFEPKDVVAGDFYWLENKGDKVFFASADCTGHGVPGAMISVVCHNALNRAVREFDLNKPSDILNKVRELVIETFEKSEEEVKDGMDIALCSLDTKTNELHYSGANNPLYIIRDGELMETKADKQPISRYINNKPFTTHQFNLEEGDTIYTFSDGYADQFGGEKGKKFKYKPFKKLLLSIQNEEMDDQHRIIKDTFDNWRGDLEQIDDVCVLGVKI